MDSLRANLAQQWSIISYLTSFFHQKPWLNVFSTVKGLQTDGLDNKERESAATPCLSASQKVERAVQWTREQVISLAHLEHTLCDDWPGSAEVTDTFVACHYSVCVCVCVCVCVRVTKILVPAMIWHTSHTHINTPARGRGWCVATEVLCVCLLSCYTHIPVYPSFSTWSSYFGLFGFSAYHWLRQKATGRKDGACLRLKSVTS